MAIALAGSAIAGCRPEPQIHSYQIPKEIAPSKPAAVEAGAAPLAAENLPAGRMLAAIVLRPAKAWFFKMSGPLPAVTAHAEEFEKFIRSLRFAGEDPPEWPTPSGWTRQPAGGMRFATLQSPPDSPPVEIAVTMLPFSGGGPGADDEDYLLSNINRWRGQLLAPPIAADELNHEIKRVEIAGATAAEIDIVGKLAPTGMGPPAMGPAAMGAAPHAPFAAEANGESAPQSDAQPGRMLAAMVLRSGECWFFKLSGPKTAVAKQAEAFQKLIASLRFDEAENPIWQAPDDWTLGPTNRMRYATLVVPGEPAPLELTISKLPYPGGDPLEYALKNVNRWRDQLQLPHTTRQQLSADLERVALAEGEALVVDLSKKRPLPADRGAAGANDSPIGPGNEHGN